MKYLISILLVLYTLQSWGSDAHFSDGTLDIDEINVDFSPGTVKNVKLGLANDGRWDLLQFSKGRPGVKEIKFGRTSFFCIGYCSTVLAITPNLISLSKSGLLSVEDSLNTLPEINLSEAYDETAWNSIAELVDFASFEAFPDTIGCPGCADAEVFFIEIQYENKLKRVTFEEFDFTGDLYSRLKAILLEQEANLKLAIEKLGL